MAFTLSGSIITQTVTDTSLAGLSSVSGVTTRVNAGDPKIQYIINTGHKLIVNGTLSWDNRIEELIITSATVANNSGGMMRVNGTVTIGTFAVIGNNGNSGFYRSEGLRIAKSTNAGAPYDVLDQSLFVSSTGTFNAYGAGLFLGNGVTVEAGANGIIKGCFIDAVSNLRFKMYSSNFSVEDSDFSVLSPFIFNPPASFKGNTLNNMEITGYGTFDLTNLVTLENFNNTYSSAREIRMIDQFRLELLNANVGANVSLQGWGTNFGSSARNEYYAEITKQIDFKAINNTGSNVEDVKLYARDTNNGARTNLYINNTADKIYTATSDVNGVMARQKIILFIADNTDKAQGINYPSNPDYRTKGNNLNTFDFNFIHYNYNLAGLPDYDLSQNGVAISTVGFLPDTLITQVVKATVDAYPITVALSGSALTVTGNGATLQDLTSYQLYDLAKSFLRDNYSGESETVVNRSGIEIDGRALDINLSYINYTGDMITTGVISLLNGSTFNGTRTDANGTVLPLRNVSVTGLSAGSRLCVYNQNTSTQVYNQVVAGTSYTAQYAEGVGYSIGDVLELKVAKINMLEFSTSVVVTSTGWNGLISQETNAIYNAHGVDGSTVAGISWDSGNMEFDFNDSDNNIDGADIGAWYYYFITTEIGIAEAFGALVWSQINKITNATNKVAITFDNVKSSPLQINNCWIDREDGVSIIASTSNSIQINPPAVFSTSNDDVASIKAKTDLLSFTGTDVKATLDGEDVVTDTASRDASKADVSGLSTFNPATDAVANVTLVGTTTVNTDMRGTDGANTVTPDNAGVAQIQTDISNLNNISPSEVSASVWDEQYSQHVVAGTFGKLMDLLRKANRAIDGEVEGAPTTTNFNTNLTGYTTGAFDHELMVFVSGTLEGEARPILNYLNTTDGNFTFEEAWTIAPSAGDEFIILPYHTHPISEIQAVLAQALVDYNVDTKTHVKPSIPV